MYSHLQRRITVVLDRLGREADIHERSTGSKDGFNNPSDSYAHSEDSVLCFRTYPNRNTEVSTRAGDRHQDNPLFLFPKGKEPDQEARIEYPEDAESVEGATATTMYEMQAPTVYDTHVEMFGKLVVNP